MCFLWARMFDNKCYGSGGVSYGHEFSIINVMGPVNCFEFRPPFGGRLGHFKMEHVSFFPQRLG